MTLLDEQEKGPWFKGALGKKNMGWNYLLEEAMRRKKKKKAIQLDTPVG